MTLYDSLGSCDGRTRDLLDPLLMPDESFVLGALATDGLLDRWATRLVVTDRRVLFLRRAGFERDVTGVRHERIERVSTAAGDPAEVSVEMPGWTRTLALETADEAEAVVAAVREFLQ